MTSSRRSRLLALLGLAACLALAGCSGAKRCKVSGTLTRGGKPLEVHPMTGKLMVVFRGIGDGATTDPQYAIVKPDGSFTVPGPDGKGIPPGKYRITVEQFDPFPTTDKLGGKFNERNSKIEREVTGNDHFDLDLDKLG